MQLIDSEQMAQRLRCQSFSVRVPESHKKVDLTHTQHLFSLQKLFLLEIIFNLATIDIRTDGTEVKVSGDC